MLKTLRRLIAGAVVAGALLCVAAPAAQATIHTYCNSLVPAHTRCSITYTRQIFLNTAEYNGAGTVALCERVFHPGAGGATVSHVCMGSGNYVDSGSDLSPYWPITMLDAVCSNASGFAHTIVCKGHY